MIQCISNDIIEIRNVQLKLNKAKFFHSSLFDIFAPLCIQWYQEKTNNIYDYIETPNMMTQGLRFTLCILSFEFVLHGRWC